MLWKIWVILKRLMTGLMLQSFQSQLINSLGG